MDTFEVVMAIVVVVAIGCAGFTAYAQFRATTDFKAWCDLRAGQLVGKDRDVCVDPGGKVILR
jgi:hypothetical protein